ncbi:MAG: gliding motility-associated C-terminal domain-containing protein [Flavobacteriales bacterium]|nr:gliding motility-associated C-terminal domain-containing protein [Flavobacteriales bacterium]MCB9167231.1 gliding motility-associated C-terminal domain-containing protein [Flavobacteriales bacterium]
MPLLSRILLRCLVPVLLITLFPMQKTVAQGVVPTMGKTFWLGYMENYQGNTPQSLDIFISSPVATTGTVNMPLVGWSQNFVVAPNVTTTVTVPLGGANGAMHFSSEVIENKSVLIQTQDTVAVFAINFEAYTADGTTVYPIQSLGNEYRLHAYYGLSGVNNLVSEFLIVATKDGTEVEINSSAATQGGHAVGVPWIVTLDSGETYQVKASSTAGDFTGTTVIGTPSSGTCRPFAVFSGSLCTNIPNGCYACDHIVEQDLPRNVWGTKYYSVPYSTTSGYTYRILADQNNTQVTVNGGAPINLNAGQFVEVNNYNQAACFEGNKPFSVAQLMQGVGCSNNGDPALLILNAEEQQIDNITFATVVSTVITDHYLNIITETANINQVSLDGVLVPPANFTAYPSCATQAYASIPLNPGSHTLTCPGGLSAYVYGMGSAESYAYSVGSFTPVPPINIDSVFCGVDSTGTLTLAPPNPIFDPFWTTVSDPTDTLHFGLSYTFTPPGSDIYVVTGYENLSQCEEQYFFSVEVDTPPTLVTTANGVPSPLSISICAHEQVQLNVVPDPPGTYLYNWWPDPQLNDGSLPDPIATPTQSGYFYVSVSTLNGCAVAVDSVYIQVIGGDVLVYAAETQQDGLCLGDSSQLTLTVHQIIAQDTLDGSLGSMWSNVQSGVVSNACGSVYGDALYFDGPNPRQATTNALDVSAGGTISFAMHIGAGAPPCDDADPGEDVVLEYSTNGGGTWTNIATYWEYLYPNFTTINVAIPPAAQTPNTLFRWRQLNSSGPGNDNWALDNVAIGVADPTGLDFTWTPAATLSDATVQNPMAYPTTTGWYYVTSVDNQTQCTYQDSVYIAVDAPFSITITPDTAICDVAGIQLEATPSSGSNHTWLWTPGASLSADFIEDPVATPAATTTYHVTVTTGFGCVATDSVTITVSGALGLNISTLDDDLCQGESTVLDATIQGGTANLAYDWTPAISLDDAAIQDPTASPVITTNYILTVTDTLTGCLLIDSILINVSTAYVVTATEDTTLCDPVGFQLSTLHNVPNPQISWTPANYLIGANTAAPTITFDSTMQYIVVVQDAMGCSARDTVNIEVPFDDLTFFADSSLCAGDTMVIDAGYPGSTYVWSPNGETTQSIAVIAPNDYTVVITDPSGCQTTFTTTVTVDPLPVIVLGPDTSLCVGEVYDLDAGNPGSTFLWNTTEQTQTIQVSTDDEYWVEVHDQNDCVNRDSVNVVFDPLPVIDLHDTIVCISETVVLDAENSGSWYLWNTAATSQTIAVDSLSGTYTVVVTTPTFCVDSADAQLTFIPFPQVDLGPDSALCDRDTMWLDLSNPGESYLWSNGSTDQTTYFTDDALAWGQVFNGYCTTRDTVDLVFNPLPDQIAEALRVVCLDHPPHITVLDAGNPGCTYLWNTDETTQMIEADAYGWYIVDITTPLICTITDSVYVQEYCPPACYVPNSFTPDGDGVNDLFFPSGYNIGEIELMIFDRWGELIYSGSDGDAAWDGTRGGSAVQDGVYIWKIKYRFFEDHLGTMGPEQEQVGHVTLMR